MLIDVPRLRGYGGPFSDVMQAVRGACATADCIAIIFIIIIIIVIIIIIITSIVFIVIIIIIITTVINTVDIVMVIIIVTIVISIVITDGAQRAFALEVHGFEVCQAAIG